MLRVILIFSLTLVFSFNLFGSSYPYQPDSRQLAESRANSHIEDPFISEVDFVKKKTKHTWIWAFVSMASVATLVLIYLSLVFLPISIIVALNNIFRARRLIKKYRSLPDSEAYLAQIKTLKRHIFLSAFSFISIGACIGGAYAWFYHLF